jgi:hypothetical protein
MRLRSPALFALGAATTLLVGGSAAYAVNGGSLLIGRSNSATLPTSLSNPNGTALALSSKAGTAPLKVNDTTKVAHLNADLLDGLDSTALALKAGRTGIVVGSVDDADGFVNTARCPSGTMATGGGGYASGTRDYLYYSGPDYNGEGAFIPSSWFAVADGDTYVWVVCYNSRGPVPGASAELPDVIGRGEAAVSGAARKAMVPEDAPQKRLP